MALLMGVSVLFDVSECLLSRADSSYSSADVLVALLYVLLCCAVPWLPRVAAVGVALLNVYADVRGLGVSNLMLMGMTSSIGVLAYSSTWLAVVIGGALCVDFRFVSVNDDVFTAYSLLIAFSMVAGLLCRMNQKEGERRKKIELDELIMKERMHQHQCTMRAIIDLHDTVANNLAYIASLAEVGPSSRWETISQKADEAFAATHDIVRMLQDDMQNDYENDDARAGEDTGSILSTVRRLRDDLSADGIAGTCYCEEFDAEYRLDDENRRLLKALIKEVFSNIAKHISRDDMEYAFTMESDVSMVYITETNPVSDHPQRHSRRVGLNMHERAVSGIGGSLDTKVDGDVWILKARIPLHSTQSQPV